MSSSLRSTWMIAHITLLESLRNRILAVAFAFAAVLVALSMAAASVSMGERARLMVDVGLAAASGIGSLVAVTLTIVSVGREIERHTAFPVLARPLPRWAFVLGKFWGVLATMWIIVVAMVVATAGTVWMNGNRIPAALWYSLCLAGVEMAVVVGIALLFTCYTTPVLAAIYTISLLIAGNLAGEIHGLADRLMDSGQGIAALLLYVAYYIVPDLQELSLRTQAANDLPVPPAFVGWATLYAVTYAAATLALAMILFERRKSI